MVFILLNKNDLVPEESLSVKYWNRKSEKNSDSTSGAALTASNFLGDSVSLAALS